MSPFDHGRGENRGYYTRGYLPHFDQPGLLQAITFRLVDSISPERMLQLRQGLRPADSRQLFNRIEAELDGGHGKCWLRQPEIGSLVEQALQHFDGERYNLLVWVIMPNHVHCIIEPFTGFPLAGIVKSWKSFTASQANKLLGRSGAFWQPDYFDRFIRDNNHLHNAANYIHYNPVAAGLCAAMEEWPWTSFRHYSEKR